MNDKKYVEVEGNIRRITDKACLIETDEWEEWLPYSQMRLPDGEEPSMHDFDEGEMAVIYITKWIADKKDIEYEDV